ncbi:DNA replication and repair protein RecF [Devosia subaequoris]|uniref:DNA replication and repair protein RecF n=1 Tax=Devosia subaequoris TaxID=395930 RepID=A0A7W6NBY4_9HYPH|nr:DNA replication/repair protein RecF [Devosia subaequoris]MBB4052199.1 DNA replication and repair protein RecF [Devosia subaequoris]MCP1209362.1 DNA replication/repair protein RecF [Devosia subaequoris]
MIRHISRLRLTAFRNYASAALDLDARHVVLTGPNGSGKTNLLEAISVLSPGRGLRGASFDTLQAQGSDLPWAVAATIETDDGPADIGTGALPDGGRRVRINGANARSIEAMSDYLRVLWLTPAMDGLFSGPAGDRRRFLDRLVTTLIPGHSATVSDFEKAMRQRNKLLEEDGDPRWLAAIEAQMAELGASIHLNRTDSLTHLQALIAQSLDDTSFPAARLSLTPLFEDLVEPATSAELEAVLAQRWHGLRPLDRAAGRTTSGPHRVDLDVIHAQKSMPAALGSTGEQKALLIGLILAHARLVRLRTGIVPFLLLDEIAAHLDPDRRRALFAALDGLETQCFLTGTDPVLFEALEGRAQQIGVREGRLAHRG